jgi:PTS system cellobiose-specific IIC component
MEIISDVLGRAGAWCSRNKYLGAIRNAFQNYMPLTITGAFGVIWTNVLINQKTGLARLIPSLMVLDVLNPIFQAISFATISCITLGITILVAQEIGNANGEQGTYPGVLGLILLMIVTPTTYSVFSKASKFALVASNQSAQIAQATKKFGSSLGTFIAINEQYTGANGLFTGLFVGIVGLEIYNFYRKKEALRLKMPEQVPPGVAKSFEVLIPTVLTCFSVGLISLFVQLLSGSDINALIYGSLQLPLEHIIGDNIVAVCILYVITMLFWCVGIHGNNLVSAIKEPIFRTLLYANMTSYKNGQAIPHIFNLTFLQMFGEYGGSGCTLGLIIAIMIFSKREDNRAIAGLSLVPGAFNINETVTFGIPLVLNPILDIPFIFAPVFSIITGYVLTLIGFCPRVVIEVPWTTPPLIQGFIATGGSWRGAVAQLIALLVGTLIYIPFLLTYERNQNRS